MSRNQLPVGEHIRIFGQNLMVYGVSAAIIGKAFEAITDTSLSELAHDSVDYFTASGYTILGGAVMVATGVATGIANEIRTVRGNNQ